MSHASHSSHANHSNSTPHSNNGISHSNTVPHSDNGIAHYNVSNPTDTGAPVTLTWNEWVGDTVNEKVSDSIAQIEEIREKLEWLQVNKGADTKWVDAPLYFVPDNPAIDVSGAATATFGANQKVDDNQYDALKDSLDILRTKIVGANSSLPVIDGGAKMTKANIQNLKIAVDDLAEYDASASHANHSSHGNHASHGSHASHGNHASHGSHVNHANEV